MRAAFPFEDAPDQPGPRDHFCLVADQVVDPSGQPLLVLAYGTSRMDTAMATRHGVGGGILSIDSKFVKGQPMGGPVTHFLARHIAVVRGDWLDTRFKARLDFMRHEQRQNDPARQRMYKLFEVFEEVMDVAVAECLAQTLANGRLGLPPGSRLR